MTHPGVDHARTSATMLLALLTGASAGCSTPDSTRLAEGEECRLAAEDVTRIQALEAELEAQVVTSDFEMISGVLDDSIVLMPPSQGDIVGKGQVGEWLNAWEALPFKTYAQTVESVVGCGDLAYVKTSYAVSVAPLGAAELISDSGRGLQILRKRPDGTWVITHYFFSSDRPIPTG